MRILLADNLDSFTHNLEHLLARASGRAPDTVPCGRYNPDMSAGYDLTVISPGPGHPSHYPFYGPLLSSGLPVLGVCLGLQIMNIHFGGEVTRLPGCVHGKASRFTLFGREVVAARYHSLYLSRVAPDLEVLAAFQGIPMAVRHRTLPLAGLQFHPESFMTPQGPEILRDTIRLVLPG